MKNYIKTKYKIKFKMKENNINDNIDEYYLILILEEKIPLVWLEKLYLKNNKSLTKQYEFKKCHCMEGFICYTLYIRSHFYYWIKNNGGCKMKTREDYKTEYKKMLEIIEKAGAKKPAVNENSEWYKMGFLDSLTPEFKPFSYDSITNSYINKLKGMDSMEYEMGFMDGILSQNPQKEIYKRWKINFGSLQK